MPQIFISYRREESADLSGRIGDYLERQFGSRSVFRDVDAILAGSNFVKAIQRALDDARVMLVVIGPHWIHMREASGMRRIDLPTDFVHYEIATALRTGKLVLPILIDGAALPTAAELPPDIAALADATPVIVRNDPYFSADMATAVAAFRSIVAWQPASIGVLAAAFGSLISLAYIALGAAHLIVFTKYRGPDFLIYVTPDIALIFAIIRAARTRRWLWFSLMVGAGLLLPIGLTTTVRVLQSFIFFSFPFVLVAFGLFGPRRPYRPPEKRRPTHSAVMTTSWLIPLGLYFGLVVAAHPNATSDLEAGAAFAIICAALLAGDVMALIRAWQTHSWAWGIPFAILLALSLSVIPVAVFTNMIPTHIGSLLTFLLIITQMIVLAIFGWWGPRVVPARPKVPVAVQK